MGKPEIEAFLTHLAVDLKVASSTQNQAFNALLFLYRELLNIDIADQINAVRAKRRGRVGKNGVVGSISSFYAAD